MVGREGGLSTAWVLADEAPARSLGPAVLWAVRRDVTSLDLVVDDPGVGGLLARRASRFALDPTVWVVAGRGLAPATPVDFEPRPSIDPRLLDAASLFVAAGCDRVAEHGRVVAEVAGLEVARASVGGDGTVCMEVGVGRFDREAHTAISGGAVDLPRLAEVAALVRRHRRPGAPPHPLNALAPERAMRSRLVADPALVGAARLAPVAAVVEAPDLRTATPAAAVGEDSGGATVVVVCSTGIDLDLVPTAADTRWRDAPKAGLVLALAPRDVHPVTVELAAALVDPATVKSVPPA